MKQLAVFSLGPTSLYSAFGHAGVVSVAWRVRFPVHPYKNLHLGWPPANKENRLLSLAKERGTIASMARSRHFARQTDQDGRMDPGEAWTRTNAKSTWRASLSRSRFGRPWASPDRGLAENQTGRVTCPRRRHRAFVVNESVRRALAGKAHPADEAVVEDTEQTEGAPSRAVGNLNGRGWSPPLSRIFPIGVSSTQDASGSCAFVARPRQVPSWIRGGP